MENPDVSKSKSFLSTSEAHHASTYLFRIFRYFSRSNIKDFPFKIFESQLFQTIEKSSINSKIFNRFKNLQSFQKASINSNSFERFKLALLDWKDF